MELTLPEEVLLIALDDEKGHSSNSALDLGLAGGTLLELARAEAVAVDADEKVVPTGAAAPQDPLLRDALTVITDDGKARKPKHWVEKLPGKLRPLKDAVASGLVDKGVLSEERSKVLGVFPRTRWPEADPAPERHLRERLHAVLVQGAEPTEQEALLVGLLEPMDLVKHVVGKGDRKQARQRAKAIKETGIAGDAVRKSVQAMQTAVMVAVIVPATVTAGGN